MVGAYVLSLSNQLFLLSYITTHSLILAHSWNRNDNNLSFECCARLKQVMSWQPCMKVPSHKNKEPWEGGMLTFVFSLLLFRAACCAIEIISCHWNNIMHSADRWANVFNVKMQMHMNGQTSWTVSQRKGVPHQTCWKLGLDPPPQKNINMNSCCNQLQWD